MSKAGRSKSSKASRSARKSMPAAPKQTRTMASAIQLMDARQYERAMEILKPLHAKRPDSVITSKAIAQCLAGLNRLGEAHAWWQRACEASPDDAQAWFGLGTCLRILGRREQAREALCRTVAADPTHADALIALFYEDEKRQRHDEMAAWLEQLVAAHPTHPIQHFLHAMLLERRGQRERALEVLQGAPKPASHVSFYPRWAHLLGRLLDSAGEASQAFQAHTDANQYHLRNSPGVQESARDYLANAAHLLKGLPEQDYSHWARSPSAQATQVVWQVGFPRCGTTLLDQVLDSHPNVTVVSEANTISSLITMLNQLPGRYPACLEQVDDDLAAKLQQIYLSTLLKHTGPPRDGHIYVDKNPMWTLHLPLLARLSPNARVLTSHRHPADTCLSAFTQHFGLNRAMSCFLHMDSTVALYNTVMDCDERFARLFPFQRRLAAL